MIELKCLAPAKLQSPASLLILDTTLEGMEAKLRNTLALRSFEISQEASMMREAKDFLFELLGDKKLNHHSFTVSWLAQVDTSTTASSPNQRMIEFQILKE
jgi:hypothetical protein